MEVCLLLHISMQNKNKRIKKQYSLMNKIYHEGGASNNVK